MVSFEYFFLGWERRLTFHSEINRLAAFLISEGVSKGDFIAVFTTNSPEMVITILALSKLGAVAGLINTNLRGAFRPISKTDSN